MNIPETSRHTHVPTRFLDFSMVFYNNMQSVGDHMIADERRIGVLSTLFSLSAALIEITDLSETPIKISDVVTRVLDTLFRGQREDVERCIAEMANSGLVKIDARKVTTFSKKTCTFTDEYVALLRSYTSEMCEIVTGAEVNFSGSAWIPAARYIFDYMVFRYMPEWYLFLRRVLRATGLDEEDKEKLYNEIFSNIRTWRIINRYLAWSHSMPPEERSRRHFRDYLEATPIAAKTEPEKLIGHLTKTLQICRVVNGMMVVEHHIEEDLEEFQQKTLRDYEDFADTIHTITTPYRQSVSPSHGLIAKSHELTLAYSSSVHTAESTPDTASGSARAARSRDRSEGT